MLHEKSGQGTEVGSKLIEQTLLKRDLVLISELWQVEKLEGKLFLP